MSSKDSGSAKIIGKLIHKTTGELIKEDTGTNVYQWLRKQSPDKLRMYGIDKLSNSNFNTLIKGSRLKFEFIKDGVKKVYNEAGTTDMRRESKTEVIEKTTNSTDMTLELLKKKKQIILYGPPGTGKTYSTRALALKVLGGDIEDINNEYEKYRREGRIEFITFHPSYSYEEFIEGITRSITKCNKQGA